MLISEINRRALHLYFEAYEDHGCKVNLVRTIVRMHKGAPVGGVNEWAKIYKIEDIAGHELYVVVINDIIQETATVLDIAINTVYDIYQLNNLIEFEEA